MRRPARFAVALALACSVASCNTYPATEVLVFLHAEPAVAPEADALRVTVFANGMEVAEARTETVDRADTLLARIPLAPRDGDATRTFELLAELVEGGSARATVRVGGGYVDRELSEIHAWFHPECVDRGDCGEGRTCAHGVCVASCFDGSLSEEAPNETLPRCGECTRCEAAECVPATDGDPCGCADGQTSCSDGVCTERSPVGSFDLSRGHGCAIRGGTLYCWGQPHAGRVLERSDVPVEVGAVSRPSHVAAADASTCVMRIQGGPTYFRMCWGWNINGRLAVGDMSDTSLPPTEADPAMDPDFRVIEGGLNFYCGLDLEGRIFCWAGDGRYGVGDGPMSPWIVPTSMSEEDGWVVLDVDWQNACAVHSDGRLLCWGQNANQQLGRTDADDPSPDLVRGADGEPFTDVTDVGLWNDRTCAIRGAGELWCWGATFEEAAVPAPPARVGEWDDWTAVDVGQGFVCGLRGEGELWCMGKNDTGQLGTGDLLRSDVFVRVANTDDQRFREVRLDRSSVCAVDVGGSLWCWGSDLAGVPTGAPVPGLLGLGPLSTTEVTRPQRVCF